MSDGAISGLGKIDRRLAGRLAGAGVLVVILGAMLGPAVLTTHPAATFPDATGVAARPSTGPQPAASDEPSESEEPWGDLDVPAFQPLAEFSPNDGSPDRVALASSFTIRSLGETPAIELARGLRAEPSVEFSIHPGPTPDVAVVEPKTDLQEGLRYRVRLDAPDGALAGSWTFTTEAPVHVVGTIPADRAVDVPVNTGIEVEFDQDGTNGVEQHFTIQPAVAGRFEQHDRVWAFVPNLTLAPATIYTVSVSPGIGIDGSTQKLEAGVTFRFETGVAQAVLPSIGFDRAIAEALPGERPVLSLGEPSYDEETDEPEAPDSVTVDVHRLASFDDAVAAAIALAGPDAWARYSATRHVDTSRLTRIARVEGKVLRAEAGLFLRLPFEPRAGFYVVTVVQDGPPMQLLLQVTSVGAYALAGDKDSVVWVNDLATGKALPRATVSIARGASLGATDANGVLRVPTPASLLAPAHATDEESRAPDPRFLALRAADGRRLIVPIGLRVSWYSDGYEGPYGVEDSASWWLLFRTDRETYRQTDTINVSGMIRARSDRSVPAGLELRLRPDGAPSELAMQRVRIQASDRGVFATSVHIEDVPRGSYMLDLYAGTKRVSSAWIEVNEIRKPAYRIEVETDRHVYVLGQRVRVSSAASFYDNTPVPGIDLRFSSFDARARATTDALGKASATFRAAVNYTPEGWFEETVGAAPVHPEEGQIDGSTSVVLVPSRVWLTGTGSLANGRIAIRGKLTWADIAGMEAKIDAGGFLDWEKDGPGRALASGSVRARITQHNWVRRQVGTEYDFIEKRVVPRYDYHDAETRLGTWTLTSAHDGAFRLSIGAPVPTDDYEIRLTAVDPEGRTFQRTIWASPPYRPRGIQAPFLVAPSSCGYSPSITTGLNDAFTVSMHQSDGKVAGSGRFLFLVSERGSMATTVQDTATFTRTLLDADLPGFTIRAVWLSDNGYSVADATATVDPDDKRITIKLIPDRSRYRPGGHATVAITTTGPSGRPVAADVVIQGVDEKLYSLGLARDADPAPTLMQNTGSGFRQSYTTHSMPAYIDGGCGGAGGGGGDGARSEFRDSVTFQRVTTGADGRASVAFDLSDDLTSWHLSATAVDARLDSGFASVQLPVGLPFFAEAVLAPEYLTGEQAVLRMRAFGRALAAGDSVRFTVQAQSLGLGPSTVTAKAFAAARLQLPALVAGTHRIRIDATATVNGHAYHDALIRTIHVVDTRLSGLVSSFDALEPGFTPKGGPGLTTYSISDEGRGRLIALLDDLAWDRSGRFDKLAAADVARSLLVDEFGFSPDSVPAARFDLSGYQRGGIALLSYGATDLYLSARAALVVPDLVDRTQLRDALREWTDEDSASRERQIVALAGRAGLGDDVVAALRAYVASDLTVRERLWLALGLEASGDESAARAIERDLLAAAGQRLGPWVRLSTGASLTDTLDASGLLLLLAGRLGDPVAHDVSNYLRRFPSAERVFPLDQVGYVRGFLDRLPRSAGTFAWTVAGERHEVELPPGGGYTLVLTSEQRASLSLERLDGDLAVVTSWRSPDFEPPTSTSIRVVRSVTPSTDAPEDRLVVVRITVAFGPQSVPDCYRLTDTVPSGLAPVVSLAGWPDDEMPDHENWPYYAGGQEVSWCASPSDRTHEYAYTARVVSPGTYRWEPAILQLEVDPRVGASTPGTTFTIR